MFDNVPKKDLCEQQINSYLDIPTEVWTDIFKLLPRRTLVQRVQPVNKVFKAICDRNVKSVHVIEKSKDFLWNLGWNEPKERRRLEALAGHNCPLAGHFRMTNFRIYSKLRNEAKWAVLRHSLDLLRHCQLIISTIFFRSSSDELAENCLACLALLEPAKPSYIEMKLTRDLSRKFFNTQLSELLCHSTTLNCPRLKLAGRISFWPTRKAIFEWLHHRMDMEMEHGEEMVRCLNLHSYGYQNITFNRWLLKQCVQNFERSKVPEDHRCFALTFHHPRDENELNNFVERKNTAAGEVLLLEHLLDEDGYPTGDYRLLRCLAHRVANGKEQLYTKLFKSDNFFKFNLERGDVPKVEIS